MDSVSNIRTNDLRALTALRAGDQQAITAESLRGSSVDDLRATVESGVDLKQVERALVDAGRFSDIYELSRRLDAGKVERGDIESFKEIDAETSKRVDEHEKEKGNNGKGKVEDFLSVLAITNAGLLSQDDLFSAPLYGFEYDAGAPDPTATRMVGDRMVFDTAAGPAWSIKLDSAEAARYERGVNSQIADLGDR